MADNDEQTVTPQEEPGWLESMWAGAQSVGNDLLIIREDLMDAGAAIISSPGHLVDLADRGVEALGGNLYDGSAGEFIQTNTRAGMDYADPLRWAGIEADREQQGIVADGWYAAGDIAAEAGNNVLIVREGLMDTASSIVGTPGYIVDLLDMGAEALGGNLYDGSAGDYIATNLREGMTIADPLRLLGIEARIETEQQEALRTGAAIGGEVAFFIGTLGTGAAIRGAALGGRFARAADVAAEGGNMWGRGAKWLSSIFRSSADDAARAAPAAAANTADDAARHGANLAEELAYRQTWSGTSFASRIHDGFTRRAAFAAAEGNNILSNLYKGIATSMRWSRATTTTLTVGAVGYLLTDAVSGNEVSRWLGDQTRETAIALADQLQAAGMEEAAEAVREAGPDLANAGMAVIQMPINSLLAYTGGVTGLEEDDPANMLIAHTLASGPLTGLLASQGYEIDPAVMVGIYQDAQEQEDPAAYIRQTLQEQYNVPAEVLEGLHSNEGAAQLLRHGVTDAAQTAADTAQDAMTAARERITGGMEEFAQSLSQVQYLAWAAPIIAGFAKFIGFVMEIFAGNDVLAQTDNPERLAALGRGVGADPNAVARIDHDGREVAQGPTPALNNDFVPA